MEKICKTYSHGGVTVVWQPALCIHSRRCFHGLPGVFDPARRPWVDPTAADPQAIVAQVAQCPSGALSIEGAPVAGGHPVESAVRVEVLAGGPLLVSGKITLTHADGSTQECAGGTALCRCGASKNKPFCDGSHRAIGFTGRDD